MRGLVWIAAGLGLLVSAGCTTPDRYRGLDGPPGGYVSGTSPFQRAASDLNPFSDYNSQWTLVRVVAPPGATRCRVADQSPFIPDGPKTAGTPDAKREVMLAYQAFAKSAAFECRMPDGVVKRKVDAVPFQSKYRDKVIGNTVQVKPPLVHIDPADPEAERRWSEIVSELCPAPPARAAFIVCQPGMLEKLKAEDLKAAG